MQLKTILNFVEPHHGFVYGEATWHDEAQKSIDIEIRPRKGSRAICSGCGKASPGYDTMPTSREWQFAKRGSSLEKSVFSAPFFQNLTRGRIVDGKMFYFSLFQETAYRIPVLQNKRGHRNWGQKLGSGFQVGKSRQENRGLGLMSTWKPDP